MEAKVNMQISNLKWVLNLTVLPDKLRSYTVACNFGTLDRKIKFALMLCRRKYASNLQLLLFIPDPIKYFLNNIRDLLFVMPGSQLKNTIFVYSIAIDFSEHKTE